MAASQKNGSGMFTTKAGLKQHLLQSHGTLAEVNDLRTDVGNEFAPLASLTVDEFTDAATASPNAIKLAIATVVAPVTYSGAQLDGSVGGATMVPARNVTVTTAGGTAADAPATATINGTYRGKAQTDTITVAQTATIATGTKPFDAVTSIVLPAADGTGATLAFGFGPSIGVTKAVKTRAGAGPMIADEIANGARVTTGTISTAGLYTPAAAPDGAKDYAIMFEYDPTA